MRFMLRGLLMALVLMGQSEVTYADDPSTVLIGDSIIWGTGVSVTRDTVAARMSAAGKKVINLSSPGSFLSGNEDTLNKMIGFIDGPFQVIDGVIVELGINDFMLGVPLNDFVTRYEQLLNQLQARGVRLRCTFIPPNGAPFEEKHGTNGGTLIEYAVAILWQCNAHGGVFLQIPVTPTDYFDRVHLNAAGHDKLAQSFLASLP